VSAPLRENCRPRRNKPAGRHVEVVTAAHGLCPIDLIDSIAGSMNLIDEGDAKVSQVSDIAQQVEQTNLKAMTPAVLLFSVLVASVSAVFATPSSAAPVKTEHVEAELIARHTSLQPGVPAEVALRLKIIDHWHTYWQNPGDSGLPTKLKWTLPAGYTAGAIAWPYPQKLPLGPLMNFGYEGEVLHLVTIAVPADVQPGKQVTFKAKAEWLVCNDVCIPESADLSLTLPLSASAPAEDARWQAAFVAAHEKLPAKVEGKAGAVRATIDGKRMSIGFTGAPALGAGLAFFPYAGDLIENAGAQVFQQQAGSATLLVPLADPVNRELRTVEGVVVTAGNWGNWHKGAAIEVSLPVTYGAIAPAKSANAAPAGADIGLIAALVFAIVGGLILNLMPCVFPVLGIKVMGFLNHSRSDAGLLRKQGLAFFAGVVISFWLLAGLLMVLRAAGESVGWGFQLQSPVFVVLLATLFLLMALNLAGIFEMGLAVQSAAGNLESRDSSRNVMTEAFLSGVLATVVATPCSAPFMGAALGFTLTQPAYVSLLVFTAIAVGMATPVTALSFLPKWLAHLPKPGAWMQTFKQFMAFPLLMTVVWLAWVLGAQIGNDGVARLWLGFVIIALGAWLYGHWQMRHFARAMVAALLALAVGLGIAWPDASAAHDRAQAAKSDNAWEPYSTARIADLRAQGKPIFVDFTATWCITCQVNKRVALTRPEVEKRFAELGVVRVKADWTLQDKAITEALASFGRNGVPLYVYYPKNGEPKVLPEVLTPAVVLEAIAEK